MAENGISCGAEEILELPAELVKNCHGFAMDMGGSLLKIVYRSKTDQEENNNTKNTSKLRLVSFARATQIQQALEYLKERCLIPRSNAEEKPCMLATGIGCHLFSKEIDEALDVKLHIKQEFECFAKAFLAITKRSPDEFLYPACEEEIELPRKETKVLKELFLKYQSLFTQIKSPSSETTADALASSTENASSSAATPSPASEVKTSDVDVSTANTRGGVQFPCILATLGSAAAYLLIDDDGSFKIMNVAFRGGRTLIGIGRLLTGAETFSDLISLAAIGDHSNVDTFRSKLTSGEKPKSEDGSGYGLLNETSFQDGPVYCFGRGIEGDIGQFKKEDLAKALVNTACLDIVDMMVDCVRISRVPRVYVCGGMASSVLIRRIITLEVKRKQRFLAFVSDPIKNIDLHFLREGTQLGALGAFLLNERKITNEGI